MLETRPGAQRTPRQSLEWCAYYAANAVAANVSWTSPVRLTDDERRAITASVQQFQLGESSEGSHLHAAARVYAARTGDDAYVSAIEAAQRTLFAATALIVWNGHRPALERGGFFFRHYWSECWERFGDAAELMRPLNAGMGDGGRASDVRRHQKGVSPRAAMPAVIPSRQSSDRGPLRRGPSPRSGR